MDRMPLSAYADVEYHSIRFKTVSRAIHERFIRVLVLDGGLALGTDGNPADRDADQFLDGFDVLARP